MYDRETRLVEILSSCGYDRTLLSDAQQAEVFSLARSARIELPRAGETWPSSPGADLRSGAITPLDVPRP